MTTATNTALGTIKLAGDLAGNNNGLAPELTATGISPGAYSLPSITVDSKGRITAIANRTPGDVAALIPDATPTTKGIVSVPTAGGLVISSGNLSVPTATSSVKGIASFNAPFSVTDGVVSLDLSTMPAATGSTFGVVKTGANITNTSGTISVADATSSVKGVASFGSGLTVSSGAVALDIGAISTASDTVFGVVKTGANITNTSGTISVEIANGSTFGVVKTGANITNTSGTISVADATSSVKGVASFGSGLTVSSGAVALDASIPRTNTQNTWTKAQSHQIQALTYGSTVTPDFSASNVFSLTATGNFALMNPTNVVPGTTYMIFITQDSTGGRVITWGSNFKFGTGSARALSAIGGKTDIITVLAVSSTSLLVTMQLGF